MGAPAPYIFENAPASTHDVFVAMAGAGSPSQVAAVPPLNTRSYALQSQPDQGKGCINGMGEELAKTFKNMDWIDVSFVIGDVLLTGGQGTLLYLSAKGSWGCVKESIR